MYRLCIKAKYFPGVSLSSDKANCIFVVLVMQITCIVCIIRYGRAQDPPPERPAGDHHMASVDLQEAETGCVSPYIYP